MTYAQCISQNVEKLWSRVREVACTCAVCGACFAFPFSFVEKQADASAAAGICEREEEGGPGTHYPYRVRGRFFLWGGLDCRETTRRLLLGQPGREGGDGDP